MKSLIRRAQVAVVFVAAGWCVLAGAQNVEVKDAWIRGTVPAQKATGAFMEITGKSNARLVGVESSAAHTVEIHNMTMQNGVMKMFPVEGIDVPAGKTVKLAPGGYHVMFIGLKEQMKPGSHVPLKLNFELADKKRESVELQVEVRDIRGQRAGHWAQHHPENDLAFVAAFPAHRRAPTGIRTGVQRDVTRAGKKWPRKFEQSDE